MRVLVTGDMGYVGSRLARELRGKCEFMGLDLKRGPQEDITKPEVVDKIAEFGAGCVINLAASVGEIQSKRQEWSKVYEVNALAPVNIFKGLSSTPKTLFIQASTASVLEILMWPEQEMRRPYARSKRIAENYIRHAYVGLNVPVVLRFGTVYGWNEDPDSMRWDLPINKMCRDLKTKGAISLFGAKQRRPWISVDDLVRVLVGFVLRHMVAPDMTDYCWRFSTYPVCSDNYKLITVAEKIRQVFGKGDIIIDDTKVEDTRDYSMPVFVKNGCDMEQEIERILEHA